MTRCDDPAEVVTPERFLAAAKEMEQNWSTQFGGPEGIARLAVELQAALAAQQQAVSEIRGAAVDELLQTRSLSEVAAMLGISRQAVSKIARGRLKWEVQW